MSRATRAEGFLDLVDIISRGGTAAWAALYQQAKADAKIREDIEAALPFCDPETGRGKEIWAWLLSTLPELNQHPAPPTPRPRRG